jgi:hypothetical protein
VRVSSATYSEFPIYTDRFICMRAYGNRNIELVDF